jgi:hypothetical protein
MERNRLALAGDAFKKPLVRITGRAIQVLGHESEPIGCRQIPRRVVQLGQVLGVLSCVPLRRFGQ